MYRYKELAEKIVQLLRCQFVSYHLSKQEIRGTEQHRVWFFFFAQSAFFYNDAFWCVNLGMYIIITIIKLAHGIRVK